MFDTFRSVALATAVNVGVFVASAWWSGDLDDRVAADIALIALNTLPLLLIRWNPVVAVVIMTVAYPLWVLTGNDGHILQSLPGLTAIYAAGVWSRHIAVRALALVCPTFMLGSVLSGWWEGVDILEIGYIAIVFVAVWSLGVVLAARRAHVSNWRRRRPPWNVPSAVWPSGPSPRNGPGSPESSTTSSPTP